MKKKLGSGQKRKVISESLGHKENVGMLRCLMTFTLNSDESNVHSDAKVHRRLRLRCMADVVS